MTKDEVLTVNKKMDTGWCVVPVAWAVPPAFFFSFFSLPS